MSKDLLKRLEEKYGKDIVKSYTRVVSPVRRLSEEEREAVIKAFPEIVKNNGKGSIGDQDIILATTPDSFDSEQMYRTLKTGAVSIKFFHLGELYSCLFNDPKMAEIVKPHSDYLVIGKVIVTKDVEKYGDRNLYNVRVGDIIPISEIIPEEPEVTTTGEVKTPEAPVESKKSWLKE